MKTALSVSAFSLGILLVGVGHAYSTSSSMTSTDRLTMEAVPAVEQNTEWEDKVLERASSRCVNYPGPNFCEQGYRVVATGMNDNGCAIYGCKKINDSDKGEGKDNEKVKKLKEIYKKIAELKQEIAELRQEAVKIQRLINQGNNDLEICTKEYAPVCAQPQMSKCKSGMFCAEGDMKPQLRTFPNKCIATTQHAEVIYEGECKTEGKSPMIRTEGKRLIRTEGRRHIEIRDNVRLPRAVPMESFPLSLGKKTKPTPVRRSSRWETILKYFSR